MPESQANIQKEERGAEVIEESAGMVGRASPTFPHCPYSSECSENTISPCSDSTTSQLSVPPLSARSKFTLIKAELPPSSKALRMQSQLFLRPRDGWWEFLRWWQAPGTAGLADRKLDGQQQVEAGLCIATMLFLRHLHVTQSSMLHYLSFSLFPTFFSWELQSYTFKFLNTK